jgi:hypothetical protein
MYVASNSVACFRPVLIRPQHNVHLRAAASLHVTARTCAVSGLNPASIPPFSNQVTHLAHLHATLRLTYFTVFIVPLLFALFCQGCSGAARQRRVWARSPGSWSSLLSSTSRFPQPRHHAIILQPPRAELRHSPCAAHAVPCCTQPVAARRSQEAPHTHSCPFYAGRCAGLPRTHSIAAADGN